ncbi:MAG TPA: hypothetical protein DCX29_01690 [Hyphomonas sp.]|jgi:hypothetical protein|nr:hypothetical protein [Hyphomonas sp.]|tara:strand:- start:92 stop:391 length:300 start_codon:yes stop_codon:yes gene_type:complete
MTRRTNWIKDTLADTARTAIAVAIIIPIIGAVLLFVSVILGLVFDTPPSQLFGSSFFGGAAGAVFAFLLIEWGTGEGPGTNIAFAVVSISAAGLLVTLL